MVRRYPSHAVVQIWLVSSMPAPERQWDNLKDLRKAKVGCKHTPHIVTSASWHRAECIITCARSCGRTLPPRSFTAASAASKTCCAKQAAASESRIPVM